MLRASARGRCHLKFRRARTRRSISRWRIYLTHGSTDNSHRDYCMPRVSTAYVKNIVRRGFSELVDPEPDAQGKTLIWTHFESACAYCGVSLNRSAREGRIDHAVSASDHGHNGLGNRVLACGPCNDDDKRNEHWETFLRRKCVDPDTHAQRH